MSKPQEKGEVSQQSTVVGKKPVHRLIVSAVSISLVFLVWYVFSDRITPYSNQAIVNGFVIPIVPEVSGTVSEIVVGQNQAVQAGDVLLKIDPERYQIEVEAAEIDLAKAGQLIGTDTASVATAQANVVEARAVLSKAEKDLQRILPLYEENLLPKSDYDTIETNLAQAQAGFDKARAELEKAKSQLGNQGSENSNIRAALNRLARAEVDLRDTIIQAPSVGGVTNLQIGVGHYANVGKALMTFVSGRAVWVEAQLTENNLGRLQVGNPVDIILDIAPGRVFKGEVMSIGYGVSNNLSTNLGALPDIRNSSGWLRDVQRFPVLIKFSDDSAFGLRRVGGQASVQVYTGHNIILNFIGKIRLRLTSMLSYLF
jgi:multidrug resistance efflux pump